VTATAAESATATGGPKAPRPLRIVERSLRDRRRGLVFWAIGIATYVALIVAFWPSIRGDSAMSEAIKNYPDVMKEFFGGAASFDYTKPGGFLNTQLFSLMAPLFLAAFAIGYAASIVAGEERDGQLDLVLSTPVSRQRILLEKALAVALGVGALTLVTLGVILGVGVAVDLGIGVANVVAACGGAGLVALVYGSLTLAVAAATGNRSLAIGIGWAAFAAGYLLEALSVCCPPSTSRTEASRSSTDSRSRTTSCWSWSHSCSSQSPGSRSSVAISASELTPGSLDPPDRECHLIQSRGTCPESGGSGSMSPFVRFRPLMAQ
jgi:ABC-2 type transport system permease protein